MTDARILRKIAGYHLAPIIRRRQLLRIAARLERLDKPKRKVNVRIQAFTKNGGVWVFGRVRRGGEYWRGEKYSAISGWLAKELAAAKVPRFTGPRLAKWLRKHPKPKGPK